MKNGVTPEISVIIPTLNEEKYLPHVLQGLKKQTFKDFEIIFGDGGSTDRTVQIARKYGRVVVNKRRGVGIGRNAGARMAKGKILVFLDADTRPSNNLLMAYSKVFNDNDVIAATGPILPLEKSDLTVELGYRFVSELFVKFSISIGIPAIVGSNFAMRKKIFDKVKGFDEELMTYEDWDLSERIERYGRVRFVKEAYVHTSTRRVVSWGIPKYFMYYVDNIISYKLFKKVNKDYEPIR